MPIPVSLVAEGLLDEQVLRHLLAQSGRDFAPGVCYGKRGRDHLAQNIGRFNQAAVHHPFIVLADLENDECPPSLIRQWLPRGCHSNLVLRIAVRKVESWILADGQAFAEFLGIPTARVPLEPDGETDPKARLINLARRSRYRTIREDLVPAPGSTSSIGKNYVGRLTGFVLNHWRAERACRNSPSLERALKAVQTCSPTLGQA
jgi:hypothetical protein